MQSMEVYTFPETPTGWTEIPMEVREELRALHGLGFTITIRDNGHARGFEVAIDRDDHEWELVWHAEEKLEKLHGIRFDTGMGSMGRVWDLDWSLSHNGKRFYH